MYNIPEIFILDWKRLKTIDMEDRIEWLRENLEAGKDWGFCAEKHICVLKNAESNVLYRMRWFETGKQEEVPIDAQIKLQHMELE